MGLTLGAGRVPTLKCSKNMAILLSKDAPVDTLVWLGTNHGHYIVKSGYRSISEAANSSNMHPVATTFSHQIFGRRYGILMIPLDASKFSGAPMESYQLNLSCEGEGYLRITYALFVMMLMNLPSMP